MSELTDWLIVAALMFAFGIGMAVGAWGGVEFYRHQFRAEYRRITGRDPWGEG